MTPSDSLRAASQPFDASTGLRTLDLTTADATITLAEGVHELTHSGTGLAVLSTAGVTTSLPPSTGAAESAGAFVLTAGGVATLRLDASTVLHARLLAGTGTLYAMRKALS